MQHNNDTPPALLLVDDDKTFCEVCGDALRRRGFAVSIASTIKTALAIDIIPDFAIIDLRLDNESGLHLVKHLCLQSQQTRIIVLTGYASVATAVEAVKLGATHYLTKPASIDDIIAAFGRNTGDTEIPVAENPMSVQRMEWEYLQKVLQDHNGNISAAARSMSMHRRTLQRKLQKYPVKR